MLAIKINTICKKNINKVNAIIVSKKPLLLKICQTKGTKKLVLVLAIFILIIDSTKKALK